MGPFSNLEAPYKAQLKPTLNEQNNFEILYRNGVTSLSILIIVYELLILVTTSYRHYSFMVATFVTYEKVLIK